MRRMLAVCAIALAAIMVSVGSSNASGQIHNSSIATGAVNSRTILDRGIYNRDIHTDAINSRTIRAGGIAFSDLSYSARRSLQTSPVTSGSTVRGVIGGDFDVPTGTSCTDNCDWGGYASLPFPASVGLDDAHVLVDVTTWTDGGGQTAPVADSSESSSAATCTGSVTTPTAPAGKVCIYVAGGDNAGGVKGVSVLPGTGASKYGLKRVWASVHDEDTFIDAVWAYTAS